MKVWLITWEWMADYCKPKEPIVAILNSRWSHKKVKEYVEFLYAQFNFSIEEKSTYIKNPSSNPYQAYYKKYPGTGANWLDFIYCGSHPWLYARKVEIIKISRTKLGKEKITWKEISYEDPTYDDINTIEQ
jgi:hypothetical protein